MGDGWAYQDSTGTLVVHPTGRRRTRSKRRRPTTGARRQGAHGNRARSSREQWCDRLRRKVANGQINSLQAVYAATDKFGNYQKACGDPNYRKLHAALEKARSKSSTPLIDEALRKWKQEQKAASAATGSDVDRIRNAKSANQVWETIKKGCQIAVKQLEEARKQGATDPNITVLNSKAANELHTFLGEANKWTERCGNGISLYQAFVAFRHVNPKTAATDPKAYAAQMGSLLKAVGTSMKVLPAPFNAYGEILAKCGNLFTNARYLLVPHLRITHRPYKNLFGKNLSR
jgi:hypothetical protein